MANNASGGADKDVMPERRRPQPRQQYVETNRPIDHRADLLPTPTQSN
jgi:hypothetical protein